MLMLYDARYHHIFLVGVLDGLSPISLAQKGEGFSHYFIVLKTALMSKFRLWSTIHIFYALLFEDFVQAVQQCWWRTKRHPSVTSWRNVTNIEKRLTCNSDSMSQLTVFKVHDNIFIVSKFKLSMRSNLSLSILMKMILSWRASKLILWNLRDLTLLEWGVSIMNLSRVALPIRMSFRYRFYKPKLIELAIVISQ